MPSKQQKILSRLGKLYPNPRSELNFRGDYQLVVSVILSAQCTDKKVNEVTPALFEKYKSFEDLAKARVSSLEKIIRPVNYYRTKAKNLIGMAKQVVDEHKGKLPRTHEELTTLPGVGRKTANVVLVERGIEPALPVDTHVYRVARRLGFSTSENRDQVEEDLKAAFDRSCWHNLHHWLIFHGRRTCKAQKPLCGECVLADICPSVGS